MRKFFHWLMDRPSRAGMLAVYASIPYALPAALYLGSHEFGEDSQKMIYALMAVLSPIALFPTLTLAAGLARAFFHDTSYRKRTRLRDYPVLWRLMRELKTVKPPTVQYAGRKKVETTFADHLLLTFDVETPGRREKLAKRNKNPDILTEAVTRYFSEGKYDSGLDCIRLAMDWLEEKPSEPVSEFEMHIPSFDYLLGHLLEVRDIGYYVLESSRCLLDSPNNAWYYSAFGKKVADAFESPLRKEMYLFDALLASAQKRSDEKEAWRDVISLAREEPEWERLGESRAIVKRMANRRFFANTFVLKESESLEALVKEAEACRTRSEQVPDVDFPRPVYLDDSLHDGRYALVMRHLSGPTLYDCLKRRDHSAVKKVIDALAQIHARVPVDGLPKLDVFKRTESKLLSPEFGIPVELARVLLANYLPVVEAVNEMSYVVNKDAHPENWIIGERIAALDNEVDVQMPLALDIANLFQYGDFFYRQGDKKQFKLLCCGRRA